MGDIRSIYLRLLEGRRGGVAYQLARVQVAVFQSHGTWSPAINAFRCHQGFVICADLAGVDRSSIDLRVEAQRVLIRGRRQSLEPDVNCGPLMQVLALEIDHGPFEREVALPSEVDAALVRAEQRNGVLWIHLPLRTAGLP